MDVIEGYENYSGPVYFTLMSCTTGEINVYVATTIEEAPQDEVYLNADKFTVSIDEENPENITFDFTVTGVSGYYFDSLNIYIEDHDENPIDDIYTDEEYCFIAGKTETGSLNYRFANYKPGEKYYAYLCFGNYYFEIIDFTMPGETTGIAELREDNSVVIATNRKDGCIEITAQSDIANVEGYSLDGRRVDLNSEINGMSAKANLPTGLTLVKVTLRNGITSTAKVVR
jgi:hypothetical protein